VFIPVVPLVGEAVGARAADEEDQARLLSAPHPLSAVHSAANSFLVQSLAPTERQTPSAKE